MNTTVELPLLQVKVQAWLIFILLAALVFIANGLIIVEVVLIFRKMGVDQGLSSLLTTLVNAIINLCSLGIGFWFGHRASQTTDQGDVNTTTNITNENPPNPSRPAQPANPSGAKTS